jgi:hypothetical protein
LAIEYSYFSGIDAQSEKTSKIEKSVFFNFFSGRRLPINFSKTSKTAQNCDSQKPAWYNRGVNSVNDL